MVAIPSVQDDPHADFLALVDLGVQGRVAGLAYRHGVSQAAYQAAVERHMAELTARAHIWISLWPGDLLKVLTCGRFKTRHERRDEGDALAGLGLWAQERTEHHLFGVAPDAPYADRPNYGYLAEDLDGRKGERFADISAVSAPPVAVRLRTLVRTRTTIVFGNSIEASAGAHHPYIAPVPLEAPSLRAVGLMDPLQLRSVDAVVPYVEAQIWGGLTPRDVAEVISRESPPLALDVTLSAWKIPVRYLGHRREHGS